MKTIYNINIKTVSLFILSSVLLIALSSSFAFADDADINAFSKVMCRVLDIATGTGGKAFAAFAIISVGIGFFTGKVSWGLMIGVAAGIAAIFGAPSIVAAISGEAGGDCKCPSDSNKKMYDEGCSTASSSGS
jgi:type IV secretory pathway VirB2 component (pilin)